MKPQFRVRKLSVHVAVLLGALLVLRTGHSQGPVSQAVSLPSVSNAAVGNGPSEVPQSNMRIVTIKISSVPALLKPEVRVDVHATLRTPDTKKLTTEITVENVAVFAVDRSAVSLLVSRDQAAKLIAASQIGVMHLSIVYAEDGNAMKMRADRRSQITHEGWAIPRAASANDTWLTEVNDELTYKLHKKHGRLALRVNTSKIIAAEHKIPRLLVNGPDIVKAIAISPNQVQISAIRPGVTQLNVWDESGEVRTLDILVLRNTTELEIHLKELYPDASIEVHPLQTSVLLRGNIANPYYANQIVKIAQDYYPKVLNGLTIVAPDEAGADESRAGEANGDTDRNVVLADQPMESKQLPDAMKTLHHDVIQLRHEVRQLIELLEKQVSRDAAKEQTARQLGDVGPAPPQGPTSSTRVYR